MPAISFPEITSEEITPGEDAPTTPAADAGLSGPLRPGSRQVWSLSNPDSPFHSSNLPSSKPSDEEIQARHEQSDHAVSLIDTSLATKAKEYGVEELVRTILNSFATNRRAFADSGRAEEGVLLASATKDIADRRLHETIPFPQHFPDGNLGRNTKPFSVAKYGVAVIAQMLLEGFEETPTTDRPDSIAYTKAVSSILGVNADGKVSEIVAESLQSYRDSREQKRDREGP